MTAVSSSSENTVEGHALDILLSKLNLTSRKYRLINAFLITTKGKPRKIEGSTKPCLSTALVL